MNYGAIAKNVGLFFTKNSTTILTSTAVVGVISTAVLTVRGTVAAVDEVRYVELNNSLLLTKKEVVKHTWKLYIPAAVAGTLTVASIISSNSISTRRNAVIMTAYTLSEKAYHEYKDEIIKLVGEKKDGQAMDNVAKQRLEDNPVASSEVIVTGLGDNLFYDSISGRYFRSSVEAVRKAENDFNFDLIHGEYKSLSDLYANMGLQPTSYGESVGWNFTKLLELWFSTHLSEDGRPCISVEYRQLPYPWYYKINP